MKEYRETLVNMRDNLIGAKGTVMRRQRRALDFALKALDAADAVVMALTQDESGQWLLRGEDPERLACDLSDALE